MVRLMLSVLVLFFPATVFAQCTTADLGGVVFRDYDADGSKDSNEPGVSGVTISAFNTAGSVVSSTTSNDDGDWVLAGLGNTSVRLELSGLPSYLKNGTVASSSKSAVVFSSTNSCVINFALTNPSEYCQEDPNMAATRYARGDPLGNGTAADLPVVLEFPFSRTGAASLSTASAPTSAALSRNIGSNWGAAYQRSSGKLFVAAALRRFMGLGPAGTGGIYVVDLNATLPNAAEFVDFSDLGISTGTDPRTTLGDPGLQIDYAAGPMADPNVVDKIGKVAFGDIDISEDEETLWVVNLHDKKLYELPVGVPAVAPSAANVKGHLIPDPGCSNGEYAPWGIKVHDGLVYVGMVCTAETSQDKTDLRAIVMTHNPAGADGNFTTILSVPLNYTKGWAIDPASGVVSPTSSNVPAGEVGGASWYPWIRDGLDIISTDYVSERVKDGAAYPQPILADIEFDEAGEMVLGFSDRFSHQAGLYELHVPPLYDTNFMLSTTGLPDWMVVGVTGGDILCAAKSGGSWGLESNATCGSRSSAGAGNSQGPGGGEFYYQELFISGSSELHRETANGGLAFVPRSGTLAAVSMDPFAIYSGGVRYMNSTTGATDRMYELFSGVTPGAGGKSNGLGDIEALCDPAPIQIGNVVWIDADSDGVFDPGETPVSGVTVTLLNSSGTVVSTTTTNSAGEYLFSNLTPDTDYVVKLMTAADFATGGALSGYTVTSKDAGSKDGIDSDASLDDDSYPEIALTTGRPGDNNHTYDFGFKSVSCSTNDGSSLNARADGYGARLAALVDHAIKVRRDNLAPLRCVRLKSAEYSAISAAAAAQANSIWHTAWSLGTSYISCDGGAVPAGCAAVDTTSMVATQRTRFNKLQRLIKKVLAGCGDSHSTRIRARAKRLKAEAVVVLGEIPSPFISASCLES